jgi:hypothetical protein
MVCTVCTISANNAANAQTQIEPKISKPYFVHEISAYATAGLANIRYKLNLGSHSKGFSGGIGVNYAYNINGNFAIVTGLEFTSYSSKLKMSGYSDEYSAIDDNGDAFTMMYSFDGEYRERQNVFLLSIPAMARYSTPLPFINGSMRYFVSGGLKLGIPFIARATITPGTVSTSGHYTYEARTYTELYEHGFINEHPGDKTKSRIRLDLAPMASLETGVRFPVGYKISMIAGLYVDYCFVNIHLSKDKHILEYQSLAPMHFDYNSILNTAAVKRISPFNTGLKIGIVF